MIGQKALPSASKNTLTIAVGQCASDGKDVDLRINECLPTSSIRLRVKMELPCTVFCLFGNA